MSEATEEVASPTGVIHRFPKEIIALTDAIMETGQDVMALNRLGILTWAADALIRKTKPLTYKPKPVVVQAEAPIKPEPVKAEPVKVEAPKPAVKKVEEKPVPVAVKRLKVAQATPVGKVEELPTEKVEDKPVEKPIEKASPKKSETAPVLSRPGIPMQAAIPLFSLIAAASQLMDVHYKNVPIAEKWKTNLNTMMDELQLDAVK